MRSATAKKSKHVTERTQKLLLRGCEKIRVLKEMWQDEKERWKVWSGRHGRSGWIERPVREGILDEMKDRKILVCGVKLIVGKPKIDKTICWRCDAKMFGTVQTKLKTMNTRIEIAWMESNQNFDSFGLERRSNRLMIEWKFILLCCKIKCQENNKVCWPVATYN